ncbi:MAG TPA: M48 family metalloprotease [Candidatus Baltobacteraceae bacterium]|nr:M48 family metalloprotease [Candidatus Baltobacteraceae bacterium]
MIHPVLSIIGRPNALDREVSALSVSALLHSSPAALVDPVRAAASLHLEQFRTTVWIVMMAAQIAVLAYFWSSGSSARLRDWLRARARPEFAVRFCFGALVAGIDRLAAFIPLAVEYRYMRILDLNSILFRSWLVEWIGATLIAMLVAGCIAAVVLWLADRTHQWYLYTIAGVIGFTLLITYANPVAIAPAYSYFSSVQFTQPLERDLAQLEGRAGVHVSVLQQDISRQTHVDSAYVMGWGATQRVVIADTTLAGSTPAEIRFLFARAIAWIAAADGLHVALVQGGFLVLGTALAVFISDRIGFRRDDDPVSRLALLGAVMGCVYLIAVPFYNGYVRNVDRMTDTAAIALVPDRAAAIRLEVRRSDQALLPLCPNPFVYWYFDARVPPGTRISNLQDQPDYCAGVPRQRR